MCLLFVTIETAHSYNSFFTQNNPPSYVRKNDFIVLFKVKEKKILLVDPLNCHFANAKLFYKVCSKYDMENRVKAERKIKKKLGCSLRISDEAETIHNLKAYMCFKKDKFLLSYLPKYLLLRFSIYLYKHGLSASFCKDLTDNIMLLLYHFNCKEIFVV